MTATQSDAPIREQLVPGSDRLDACHAMHLRGLENVRAEDHGQGGHDLVRRLRDDGRLPELLASGVRRGHVGSAQRANESIV